MKKRKVTVLVATSGDTGGAVADGFYKVPGTEVIILYPKGKVSPVQEMQMTTLGHNVKALEVEGNCFGQDPGENRIRNAIANIGLQYPDSNFKLGKLVQIAQKGFFLLWNILRKIEPAVGGLPLNGGCLKINRG